MIKLLIQTSKRNTFRTYSKDQKMLDETIKNKLQIDSLQVNKMIKTAPNLKNVQKNESRGYHNSFFWISYFRGIHRKCCYLRDSLFRPNSRFYGGVRTEKSRSKCCAGTAKVPGWYCQSTRKKYSKNFRRI